MEEKEKKKKVTPEELSAACMAIADDRKAEDIIRIQLGELSSIADYFVLCTGNSEPHLKAIADRIEREVRTRIGSRPRSVDGSANSHWILIDYGNVIVHILTRDMRELYQLESLWGDAPQEAACETLKNPPPKKGRD